MAGEFGGRLSGVEHRFEVGKSPLDQAVTNLGHRQALGLEGPGTRFSLDDGLRQPQLCAPAELFGTEGGDVHEQKSALDGRRGLARDPGFLDDGLTLVDFDFTHNSQVYWRLALCGKNQEASAESTVTVDPLTVGPLDRRSVNLQSLFTNIPINHERTLVSSAPRMAAVHDAIWKPGTNAAASPKARPFTTR